MMLDSEFQIPLNQNHIDSAWREQYQRELDALTEQFLRLNTSMLTLERLEKFPLTLFFSDNFDWVFWSTISHALIDSIILNIWRIALDEQSDTLSRLKSHIMQNLTDKQATNIFKQCLKAVDFDTRIKDMKERIRQIRHNFVAHFNIEALYNPTGEIPNFQPVTFKELRTCVDIVGDLFDVLCLNQPIFHYKWSYASQGNTFSPKGRIDIDRIFDAVIKSSSVLNMAEKDPFGWQMYCEKVSDIDLAHINHYRGRFGLAYLYRIVPE